MSTRMDEFASDTPSMSIKSVSNRPAGENLLKRKQVPERRGDGVEFVREVMHMHPFQHSEFVRLSEDLREVKYHGPAAHGGDVGVALASKPIAPHEPVFYFEVKILDFGAKGSISVGIGTDKVNLRRHPGTDKHSFAIRANSGNAFHMSNCGKACVPACSTGDVIGCGVQFEQQAVFFTRNGKYYRSPFTEVIKFTKTFHPIIALHSKGEAVRVNFGQDPYEFNLKDHVSKLANEQCDEIRGTVVDGLDSAAVLGMVKQYLAFNAYSNTLDALNSKEQTNSWNGNQDGKLEQGREGTNLDQDSNNEEQDSNNAEQDSNNKGSEVTKLEEGSRQDTNQVDKSSNSDDTNQVEQVDKSSNLEEQGNQNTKVVQEDSCKLDDRGKESKDHESTQHKCTRNSDDTTKGTTCEHDSPNGIGAETWKEAQSKFGVTDFMIATLQQRSNIRKLILDGKAIDAADILAARYANRVASAKAIMAEAMFQLSCLHVVELIKIGNITEAVVHSRECIQDGFKNREELHRAVGLLCYVDPATSPEAHLLSQRHRENIADRINRCILEWHTSDGLVPNQTNNPKSTIERHLVQLVESRKLYRHRFLHKGNLLAASKYLLDSSHSTSNEDEADESISTFEDVTSGSSSTVDVVNQQTLNLVQQLNSLCNQ